MPYKLINLSPQESGDLNDQFFAKAVIDGLSRSPKVLPSWLIFDDKGSDLFQKITELKDYQPAMSEFEIFHNHKARIAEVLSGQAVQIIDLGSGDARKTRVLLKYFLERGLDIHFIPIDISEGAVKNLLATLDSEFGEASLPATGIAGDYFEGLENIPHDSARKNFVCFLGSTLGNRTLPNAETFLARLHDTLNAGDWVMIGFDLMKNPKILYKAYNDPGGVFETFNLHLLDGLNQKLGANFDKSQFVQQGHYNWRSRAVESHIYSTRNQTVDFQALNRKFHFGLWESMQTEHSYKYTLPEIEALAAGNGFKIVEHLFDEKQHFVDSVWQVIK